MPFEPLNDREKELHPPPCRDREHDPPRHIVIKQAMAWVCPSCGRRIVVKPPGYGVTWMHHIEPPRPPEPGSVPGGSQP